jgi:hypothetical protein
MNPFGLESINKDDFAISACNEGTAMVVKLSGKGDIGILRTLNSVLGTIHRIALRSGVHEVVVDCHELYFMSSSCIKSVVTWIDAILKLPPTKQYKVRFLSNPQLSWQHRSLEAVRRFAPALVDVNFDSSVSMTASAYEGSSDGWGMDLAPHAPPLSASSTPADSPLALRRKS